MLDTEIVILVDRDDNEIGVKPKLQAHREGQLHRAFSVFIVNAQGALLLQKRSWLKYHSAGLWSNTCCGHPRPGEDVRAAAERRLHEEMGFRCQLQARGSIYYKRNVSNDLIEHEVDHVFVGKFDGDADADPNEVGDTCWMSIEALKHELKICPNAYTYWLPLALAQLETGI